MDALQQNQQSVEPELKDALLQLKKEIFLDLHTKHVAVIEEFDAETQTATIRIAYKKTFFQLVDGTLEPVLKEYPKIADVPCIFLRGGTASLRLPVVPGDECLYFVNDRDIDGWYESGDTEGAPPTLRLHNITDGFALVGIGNAETPLDDFDPDQAELRYDGTKRFFANPDETSIEHGNFKVIADDDSARLENGETIVGVGGGKVTFENTDTSLKTELQALITQLTTLNGYLQNLNTGITLLTVTCAGPGAPSSPPINAATFTAISINIGNVSTSLNNIKTNLGNLLA